VRAMRVHRLGLGVVVLGMAEVMEVSGAGQYCARRYARSYPPLRVLVPTHLERLSASQAVS
jgi:ATP-dependent Clp protease adapter protein ClpS